MEPLLSILIPIYNVEEYLDDCIRSVLAQELDEASYEVILTDDGSTDRSGAIARAYAERYAPLHYYYKENGGLSSARNAGLARARGKYLLHIDSDDWLEPAVLRGLLDDAEQRTLDLCLIDWADRYPDGRSHVVRDLSRVGSSILTGEQLIGRDHPKYGTSWSFLMRREVVERGRLSFVPLQPGEDIAFFVSALPYCRRVGYHDRAVVYSYRRDRPGAITVGPKADKDLSAAMQLLDHLDATYPYGGDRGDYAALLAPWYDDILADMAMRRIPLAGEQRHFREIMRRYAYRYRSERGARRVAFALMEIARRSYRLSELLWSVKKHLPTH